MKGIISSLILLLAFVTTIAQTGTQPVEPNMETSYENYELLFIAIAGLAILLLIYFYFKRTRR